MYYLEEEDRSTMERKPKLLLVMGLLVGNLFFSSDHLGSHWSTLEPLHMLSTDHWTGLVDWTGGLDWWTDTKNNFYSFQQDLQSYIQTWRSHC